MSDITLDQQTARLEEYEKGFLAVHLIATGVELCLFRKMKDSGMRPADLAAKLGLHEPYVRIWCQVAHHMEILDCDDKGRFRLAPHMDTLLTDVQNPYYFGDRARFMIFHASDDLRGHSEDYKSGQSHSYSDHEEEFSRVAKSLTRHIVPLAYLFMILPSLPELKKRLDTGIKVLDIG